MYIYFDRVVCIDCTFYHTPKEDFSYIRYPRDLPMADDKKLSFDDNRHHDGCPSGHEVAILGKLTTKGMHELRPFDTRVGEDRLLIGVSDSLEDLLVHSHHLL